jgi:DedD protein
MRWAFWRKADDEPAGAARERRTPREAGTEADPALALRVRARRRLIGAAALLLAAVIVVPMVLDPAPRPVPDTVPIDIPSEKTPFSPRLPLPTVPDPAPPPAVETAGAAKPTADAKAPAGDRGAAPTGGETPSDKHSEKAAERPADRTASKAADTPAEKSAAKPAADAAQLAEAQRARDILEGKSASPASTKTAAAGKFYVQAAAPRSEQAAGELAAKLKKAGLPSFTERVQASDGTRWRVRVGPYATRQEAERARVKLRELGTGADLIAP